MNPCLTEQTLEKTKVSILLNSHRKPIACKMLLFNRITNARRHTQLFVRNVYESDLRLQYENIVLATCLRWWYIVIICTMSM